jgi:hypothetical protein
MTASTNFKHRVQRNATTQPAGAADVRWNGHRSAN